MLQSPNLDLETGRAQGATAIAQESTLDVPDARECVSSDDVDLLRTFFELLEMWETQDRHGN